LKKCSTADSKSGSRGLLSRTNFPKIEKMFYHRLQIRPRAGSKVEQNLQNLKKCSTADSKSGSRGSESRTKSPKFEKMFYHRLQIRPPFTISTPTAKSADRVRHPHPKNPHKKRPNTMPGLISLFS